jgi:Sulfotransferase family
MIVCHEHQFIFIRLPKTASTSLVIALSGFCGPGDVITKISPADEATRRSLGFPGPRNDVRPWYRYPVADLLTMLAQIGDWPGPGRAGHLPAANYYKHASANAVRRFVGRDVWDRYYKFCIERNPFDRAISRYYFDARRRALPDINTYVCSLNRKALSNWTRYTVHDRIAVDHVGRYEHLQSEVVALSARLGLPGLALPATRAKAGYRRDRRHYSQVLNGRSRRHIEAACAREIEMFSYTWTDVAADGMQPASAGPTDEASHGERASYEVS